MKSLGLVLESRKYIAILIKNPNEPLRVYLQDVYAVCLWLTSFLASPQFVFLD